MQVSEADIVCLLVLSRTVAAAASADFSISLMAGALTR